MRRIRAWLLRPGDVFRSGPSEADLCAELQSHLQLHTDENLRAGMTPQEARRDLRIRRGVRLGAVELATRPA